MEYFVVAHVPSQCRSRLRVEDVCKNFNDTWKNYGRLGPDQTNEDEMRRRLERIVILHQTKSHSHNRQELPASRIIHLGNIFRELIALQESSNRDRLLSLLINHDRHPRPAIRMATAR